MSKLLLDLGTQPLVGNLCSSKDESLKARQYPLQARYNDDLKINLNIEIEPKVLYNKYCYHSGVSQPYIKHCEDMFSSFKHLKSNTIIDVGGNDGTLLKTFKRLIDKENDSKSSSHNHRYINVDASESFKSINEKAGIEYIQGFFSEDLNIPKADIITSTNVFQHTKDIDSFMRGIVKHLDGIWILEFPYTFNTLKTLQFDQFYHEHYYYWLITPLEIIFKNHGLKIIDISESDIHGGSMRIWSTNKQNSTSTSYNLIKDYKDKESSLEIELFNSKVKDNIKKAKEYIYNLPGKTIFFGAAHKGCVFLNALDITTNTMPDAYVIDDTKAKQGLYVPGTGFEILSREKLITDDIQNIIILPHNFGAYIANSLRFDNHGNQLFEGDIITMLPEITHH